MHGPRVNREMRNRPMNPVGREEETRTGAETLRIAVGPSPENHPKCAGIRIRDIHEKYSSRKSENQGQKIRDENQGQVMISCDSS